MPTQKIGLLFVLAIFSLLLQSFQSIDLVELNAIETSFSEESDDCPDVDGNSTVDRLGCLDTDGDGVSDPDDVWTVSDGADPFPFEPTQWKDTDKDGWGDNTDIDAKMIDFWPYNSAKYRANILIGCDPPSFTIEPGVDVAFVCKITNPMPDIHVRVRLKMTTEEEISSSWDSKIIELGPDGETGSMELIAIYISTNSLGRSGGELQAWVGEHETPSGIINLPVLVTVSEENEPLELNEELVKSIDLSELHNDIEEITVSFTESTGIPFPIELFYASIIMLILAAIRRNIVLRKSG